MRHSRYCMLTLNYYTLKSQANILFAKNKPMMRRRAAVARWAHNPEAAGSIPADATNRTT